MSQRTSSSLSFEKKLARPYASFNFHELIKLSWQELHLRFTPRNTWALFWAACITGVWLAFTSPRQFTPIRNPSVSGFGFSRLATNWLYGRFFSRDWSSHG